MSYEGKQVVVTGGTGALGRAVVGKLLAAGSVCHIPNYDAAEVDNFPFKDDGALRIVSGIDLSDETSVEAFYGGLPSLWASIHIAGGFAMAPLGETSRDDFMKMQTMNVLTCFLCCREAAKIMRRDGGSGGRIVNIAARPGLEPRSGAGMAAYTASKAGVAALTETLGEELAADGIWVNAVAPSIIDTPANRSAMPDADYDLWPKPEELAETIVFLASPDNTSTRSAVVPVYGRS
ncbi:MAG: SDR family NAD(P)-dependent oxidoreductase [Rhodospirillales bacterium]|nr:SDR family NAD(P)-dependent oxidoreductase [Rhodospirillales bacterium]